MRNYFFHSLVIVLFLSGCASNKGLKNQSSILVLKGATIYTGSGQTIANGIILIKNGLIAAIGNANFQLPKAAKVLDVRGKYIMPGMVDAHVHYFQTGFFDSRPDALDITKAINYDSLQAKQSQFSSNYFESYLRSGVTATYDVGGFRWSLNLPKLAENNVNAPHIAASGPLITPATWQQVAKLNTDTDTVLYHLDNAKQGIEVAARNIQNGATGVKIWWLPLKDTTFKNNLIEVSSTINNLGNKMIVHATSLAEAKAALRLGAKVLVHSVDDELIDEEFIQLAKRNDITYIPTLLASRGYLNSYKALKDGFTIADPNDVIDKRTKELLANAMNFFTYFPNPKSYDAVITAFTAKVEKGENIMFQNLKKIHAAGIRIAAGTDAGNPGTFHGLSIYAELEAMQKAGISAIDIITMSTQNGAMAMARENDFGTLEKGKLADLIILEKDPAANIANIKSITQVVRGGFMRAVKK